jgi:HlyD family secretion protein
MSKVGQIASRGAEMARALGDYAHARVLEWRVESAIRALHASVEKPPAAQNTGVTRLNVAWGKKAEQVVPMIAQVIKFRRRAPSEFAKGVDPAAVTFLPDPAMIEERRLPWIARSVVYIIAALIVTTALWASLSQVDRVVTARGKLITIDPLMVVQPLETAVVRSIDVGVGDFVKAGTVLATLDPTFSESQEEAGRERLGSMQAEAKRLEAEIYNRPYPPRSGDDAQSRAASAPFRRAAAANVSEAKLSEAKVSEAKEADNRANPVDQNAGSGNESIEGFINSRTEPTAKWLRQHREWITDPRKNAKLMAAHFDAIAQGIAVDTPEYFEHVETYLGLRGDAGKAHDADNSKAGDRADSAADDDAEAGQPLDPKYLKLQTAVYEHRRAEYDASVASSDAEVARLQAALVTNRTAQDGLQQRLKVVGEVESMRKELYNIAAGSRLNLLLTQMDRLSLADQLGEKQNQEKEILQQLGAARQQKERYINNWIREAGERLTSVQQDIATAKQQLAAAERRRTLVVLRAPADGVVLELGQRSIGSVAKEAEPLVTLVPHNNRLEAEVDVDSSDVAHLRVGDPVRVKFDALPFQRHGTVAGTLRVITENSFQSDKSAAPDKPEARPAFFRARVALGPVDLNDVPKDFRLIPGMTLAAEIKIGKRSIVSYVLDPVVRLFDESLREP